MLKKTRFTLLAPAAFSLAACGGGSGSSLDAIFSSFFVQDWNAYETAATNLLANVRYSVQNATGRYDTDGDNVLDTRLFSHPIRSTGIQYAHAAGLTGQGQFIAVSDDGFRLTHETISDDIDSVHGTLTDQNHGTAVSSVITGDSTIMVGVAPNAELMVSDWDQADMALLGQAALTKKAVAWNNSWGYTNSNTSTSFFNGIFSGSDGTAYLQALRDYSAYGNVIFAIDNDAGRSTIGLMAGLPIRVPELIDGWIAVVNGIATTSGHDVTDVTRVSGACLEAAEWCITASGTWYAATNTGDSTYAYTTGSSFAAPTVAGSLALLAEAFPDLNPHELRLRLFATADKTFTGFSNDQVVTLAPGYESAVDTEFGHGFLDVAQALQPIGRMTVISDDNQTIDVSQPLVQSGTAAGTAIASALSDIKLHATDVFAGAFAINADTLVQTANASAFFADQTLALNGTEAYERTLSSAIFDRDPTVQNYFGDIHLATYLPQHSDENETAGFSIGQRRLTSFGHVDWQAGVGSDNGALLPMWQNEEGQDLASLGFAMTSALSDTSSLQVSAVMATAPGRGNTSSIFMNSSEISYTQAQVFDRNDRLKLSLRQPFAITSGSTDLTIATNSGGSYQMQTFAVDLAPAKREMQIALDYEIDVARDTELMLSLVHAMNRGHLAGKEESGVFFGYRKSF